MHVPGRRLLPKAECIFPSPVGSTQRDSEVAVCQHLVRVTAVAEPITTFCQTARAWLARYTAGRYRFIDACRAAEGLSRSEHRLPARRAC